MRVTDTGRFVLMHERSNHGGIQKRAVNTTYDLELKLEPTFIGSELASTSPLSKPLSRKIPAAPRQPVGSGRR